MKKISFTTSKILLKKKRNKISRPLNFNISKKKFFYLFRLKLKLKKKLKKKIFFIRHNKKIKFKLHKLKFSRIKVKKKTHKIKIFRRTLIFFKKCQLISKKISKRINFRPYDLHNNFLLFIFRTGKKSVWSNKFASLFDTLSLKLQYSKSIILLKLFTRLYTRVEVKKVKSRKRITYIPFFIKLSRSLFLVLKWIFLASLKKKGFISFKNKLYIELLQILIQKSSFSLQKLEENNIAAFKNRSNIHYRWQKTR